MFLKINQAPRGIVAGARALLLAGCVLLVANCESPGPRQTTASAPPPIPTPPLTLSPLDQSRYQQALAALRNGQPQNARETLEKLSRQYDAHLGLKINLATLYYQVNDIERARRLCGEALAIDPGRAHIHNLSGLIAVASKHFTKAEGDYLQALKLDENYANAHYNLALLYDIYYQDIPAAYRHYSRYLALEPEDKATQDWLEQLKYSLERD